MKQPQTALKEQAYEAILQQILSGEIAPGTILNRRSIARQLNMSMAPVHEAMLQLEFEGLMQAIPRTGTIVRQASLADLVDHLFLREALETQVARLVVERKLHEQLHRLEAAADLADQPTEDFRERVRKEVDFHLKLAEVTGCRALCTEYKRIMRVGLFYRIHLLIPESSQTSPRHPHRVLLDQLQHAAPEQVFALVRKHIWAGKEKLPQAPSSS